MEQSLAVPARPVGAVGSPRVQSTRYKVCYLRRIEAPGFVGPLLQDKWLTTTIATGVMRFLQTEWHRHERDRNAWQIERAEMKSRIGKLEGDGRTSKRLQESLGKHVKILENALKKEREKVKALQSGQAPEETKEEAASSHEGGKASLKRRYCQPSLTPG